MSGQPSWRGQAAIAASAAGYGVGTALARTTATSGALLSSIDAIATVLLAALFLRERVGAVVGAALALGTAGTILVALDAPDAGLTAGTETLGNLLVLASVLGGAGYVVWSRRTAPPAEEGVGRTAWQFLGATLAVLPFVLGSWWTGGSRIAGAEPSQLIATVAVLFCGLGALLAFNIGIGTVSASRAGLLFTLQPLAGALTAVVVLGEPLVAGQAAGGALILACLAILTRDRPGASPDTDTDTTSAANAVSSTR
jgi:drug/metabolite transporter (DMT)-like permease